MFQYLWPRWYTPVSRASVGDITELGALISGVTVQAIKGKSRLDMLVRVRHAICLIAVEIGHGIAHTGRCLDRDHSTVMNSLEKAKILIEKDEVFAAFVSQLRFAVMVRRPVTKFQGVRRFAVDPERDVKPVSGALRQEAEPEDEIELLTREVARSLALEQAA
jgi:hypothetical protein